MPVAAQQRQEACRLRAITARSTHVLLAADDFRGVAEPLNETACGCTQCDCPGVLIGPLALGCFVSRSAAVEESMLTHRQPALSCRRPGGARPPLAAAGPPRRGGAAPPHAAAGAERPAGAGLWSHSSQRGKVGRVGRACAAWVGGWEGGLKVGRGKCTPAEASGMLMRLAACSCA